MKPFFLRDLCNRFVQRDRAEGSSGREIGKRRDLPSTAQMFVVGRFRSPLAGLGAATKHETDAIVDSDPVGPNSLMCNALLTNSKEREKKYPI